MKPGTRIHEEPDDNFQLAPEHDYLKELPALSRTASLCAPARHLLMIFSGLHAGASMPLANGAYSIGRSYECDIVLKDPGIVPVHLNVICNAGSIVLRPVSGGVHLDGQCVERETMLPETPAVVTIAGVHLGMAIEGAAWYPLDLPTVNANCETGSKISPAQQAGSNSDMLPQVAYTTTFQRFISGVDRLRRAGALCYIVTISFVLIFIICAIFFFHVKEPDHAVLITDIDRRFAELYLPKPDIQNDAEGFITIIAYVPSAPLKEAMTDRLQTLPVATQLHIYVDDQVKRALNDYISKMGFPVEATYQGNGKAIVKGFVETQHKADVMEDLLKNNVTGLRTIDGRFLRMDRVRTELAAVMKDAGMKDKINLEPKSGRLLAVGTLDAAERSRWQAAKEKIRERLGQQVEIIDQINDRLTIAGKIDISIAGVTMHPYPFITLQDGKVYFKGASLKNGTIIKDIGPKRIIVEIDGRDYHYNF